MKNFQIKVPFVSLQQTSKASPNKEDKMPKFFVGRIASTKTGLNELLG